MLKKNSKSERERKENTEEEVKRKRESENDEEIIFCIQDTHVINKFQTKSSGSDQWHALSPS